MRVKREPPFLGVLEIVGFVLFTLYSTFGTRFESQRLVLSWIKVDVSFTRLHF